MKLIEALTILRQRRPEDAPLLRVALACGFTPLHLQTFLAAYLREQHPGHRVAVEPGLFGDAEGNIRRLAELRPDAAAVVLEWSDLDPRLGLRHLGGWGPGVLPDIVQTVAGSAARLIEALASAIEACPVALSLPSLPLPPVSYTPGRQAGSFELDLQAEVSAFAARAARLRRCRVVNPQRLDRLSPPAQRRDVKAELNTGFPYRLGHADALASLLAPLLRPSTPKKGLIIDLDDTLWRGILGDVGIQGISWDLDNHTQIHGVFQQFLHSLAEAGVLLAVASKNTPEVVEEALRRDDLVLPARHLFPLEVHWGPKSESVARILKTWNIAADSVVFVDDSPMELAEVQAVHPDLLCLRFPAQDDQEAFALLETLRDHFGKDAIAEEDAFRLESIRQAATLREAASDPAANPDEFLRQADAELTLDFTKDADDPRALELVNKTNQFNLNGRRQTEAHWRAFLTEPDTFLLRASYRDKYGPLGTIAVVAGRHHGGSLSIESWVMSCRAFSRRIEHRCLEQLFARFEADEIRLSYEETPRNGPLRDFLASLRDDPPGPDTVLNRHTFTARCPPLFHRLKGPTHG
jgi:FkbH-like protein